MPFCKVLEKVIGSISAELRDEGRRTDHLVRSALILRSGGMNYFAHGCPFLDDPYFLAGTAVPDWLSVVDRRVRARRRLAVPWSHNKDPQLASLAAGIIQHHHDDRWFHATRAFAELNFELAEVIRDHLTGDRGFRPMFLGHILIEILLDAALIEQSPETLERYYARLESLDPERLAEMIHRMTSGRAERLPDMIRGFCRVRFLDDYRDDHRLWTRLNSVMKRARLRPLPESFTQLLPGARHRVLERGDELLEDKETMVRRCAG